jgi:hypothetical protein
MLPTRTIKRITRKLRRSQTGQAIIILALGFIILLGFVGIVTDISLLYIRYAALRRAVDSAAVAAAGQMRTDRDLAAPRLAAVQFLEFHGINTSGVFVETCADMPLGWNPDSPDPVNPPTDQQQRLYTDVCDSDRKLVRVTAYIESPTVFMSLPPFNFESLTLQASAISETASLDVVVVLDVSDSMLFETTYDTWNEELFESPESPVVGQNYQWTRWLPPRLSDLDLWYFYEGGGQLPSAQLRRQILRGEYNDDDNQYSDRDYREGDPFITAEPDGSNVIIDMRPAEYFHDFSGNPVITNSNTPISTPMQDLYGLTPGTVPSGMQLVQMRDECRVRIHPRSEFLGVEPELSEELSDFISLTQNHNPALKESFNHTWAETERYSLFRPSFNWYGCCNDPTANASITLDGDIELSSDNNNWGRSDQQLNGKFDFSDLVCQPFKDARDATRLFLQNIDFARGDRVAFVTFDRAAYLIDPDGYSYFTDQNVNDSTPGTGFGGGARSHMIDDFQVAVEVLDKVIGVRAEPNFYWTDHNPDAAADTAGLKSVDQWETYSRGTRTIPADINNDGAIATDEFAIVGVPLVGNGLSAGDYNLYYEQPIGEMLNGYPVRGNCQFSNAALPGSHSIWSDWQPGDTYGNSGPIFDIMHPPIYNPAETAWRNRYQTMFEGDMELAEALGTFYSYEYRAGCRGTNIGASLREANNALVSPVTTRQEGAVWVIILLSDGAAGATDPIPFDNDPTNSGDDADPYLRVGDTYNPQEPPANINDRNATYGAYGFCPYGTTVNIPDSLGGLTDSIVLGGQDDTVYCLDPDPSTRHSCNTDATGTPWEKENDDEINGVLNQMVSQTDRGNAADCRDRYDADDYARDWADYIAMDRRNLSGEQLPTVFTIGFNLDYPQNPGSGETWCTANLQMCLGEELLRYIANIGDNNEYDPDEYPDSFANPVNDHGRSYGNYYNAPDREGLSEVFDEIASKLFTRLSG